MPRKRIVAAPDRDERKRRRNELGNLEDLKVLPSVKARYRASVSFFLWWCWTVIGHLANTFDELDQHVCAFIKEAWQEGEPRSLVADTMSGLMDGLERKKILPVGWSWLTVWEKHEMPERSPPLSLEQILALSGLYLAHSQLEMSVMVLLGFHCMMRTAELLGVRAQYISVARGKAAITLMGKTGTRMGAPETVTVDDDLLLALLARLVANKRGTDLLFAGTSSQFRKLWEWGIAQLLLDVTRFHPYSMRRGGATWDWMTYQDAGRLCMRGRWGSIKTAKIYAVEGQRLFDKANLTQAQIALQNSWARRLALHVG